MFVIKFLFVIIIVELWISMMENESSHTIKSLEAKHRRKNHWQWSNGTDPTHRPEQQLGSTYTDDGIWKSFLFVEFEVEGIVLATKDGEYCVINRIES